MTHRDRYVTPPLTWAMPKPDGYTQHVQMYTLEKGVRTDGPDVDRGAVGAVADEQLGGAVPARRDVVRQVAAAERARPQGRAKPKSHSSQQPGLAEQHVLPV